MALEDRVGGHARVLESGAHIPRGLTLLAHVIIVVVALLVLLFE